MDISLTSFEVLYPGAIVDHEIVNFVKQQMPTTYLRFGNKLIHGTNLNWVLGLFFIYLFRRYSNYISTGLYAIARPGSVIVKKCIEKRRIMSLKRLERLSKYHELGRLTSLPKAMRFSLCLIWQIRILLHAQRQSVLR
ncbi:hypothetical protein M3J09_000145 [Ascochyta lentis]